MKEIVKNRLLFAVSFFAVMFLVSCSSDDYVNVIPRNSTALVSIDLQKMAESYKEDRSAGMQIVKSMLKVDNVEDCGIDVADKLYVFESVEGNVGLVAKVGSGKKLEEWIDRLSDSSICTPVTERKGYKFTLLKDSWVVGFSSDVLLVMGPIVASQQSELQQQMVKYFENDEERSIKGTPVFERLDSIKAPVAIVAQVAALPEKFVAPFTLGAPKNVDASQIMLAAGMSISDDCLYIEGGTFSFNKQIDSALKESLKIFRPIEGKYTGCLPKNTRIAAFMNVEGGEFINLLHANKSFQAVLAGINTAIDMDNIIRCVDGDMTILINRYGADKPDFSMVAQLGKRDFLADIDYWKKSCPAGCRIGDWGKDAYFYTDGTLSFYFGVSPDNQFYSGMTQEKATESVQPARNPVPQAVQDGIKGRRLCMVLSISGMIGSDARVVMVRPIIKSLLGDMDTVVLSVCN